MKKLVGPEMSFSLALSLLSERLNTNHIKPRRAAEEEEEEEAEGSPLRGILHKSAFTLQLPVSFLPPLLLLLIRIWL